MKVPRLVETSLYALSRLLFGIQGRNCIVHFFCAGVRNCMRLRSRAWRTEFQSGISSSIAHHFVERPFFAVMSISKVRIALKIELRNKRKYFVWFLNTHYVFLELPHGRIFKWKNSEEGFEQLALCLLFYAFLYYF